MHPKLKLSAILLGASIIVGTLTVLSTEAFAGSSETLGNVEERLHRVRISLLEDPQSRSSESSGILEQTEQTNVDSTPEQDEVAQNWYNWDNWGNWSNWDNWGNWSNWDNWGNWSNWDNW